MLGELSPREVGGAPIAVTGGGGSRILELVLLLSVIGLVIGLVSVIYGSMRRRRHLA